MIRGVSIEMAGPEGGFPLPGSPLQTNRYSNPANNVARFTRNTERDPSRDSGVDVCEGIPDSKEDYSSEISANKINSPDTNASTFLGGNYVSENFCINSMVNGTREVFRRDSHDNYSIDGQCSMRTENLPSPTYSEVSSRSFSYSTSSANTCSTILEEESPSPATPSSGNMLFCERENSKSYPEENSSESDDKLFNPEGEEGDEEEDEGDALDMASATKVDMKNTRIFVSDNSTVNLGTQVNMKVPPAVSKIGPDITLSTLSKDSPNKESSSHFQESCQILESTSSPGIHFNITNNTPPVQAMPPHFPASKTRSMPGGSRCDMSKEVRENPRLIPDSRSYSYGNHAQVASTFGNMGLQSYSPTTQGGVHIQGAGSVVLGPQFIINAPPSCVLGNAPTPVIANNLDKVLQDAGDKLVHNYKYQTKRSLLPWLKGRQVIPMTDFYTESRILAVDRQGKQTRKAVDLVSTLMQDDEARFIVEGEPGMGKTLLACKLAIDWANKKTLHKFKFVFLILLRDFKDSLEDHVKEELLTSLTDEKFKQVWDYCKNNEEQVLFILDGYDELEKSNETKIQKLIEGREFQRSKVVVTSRPDKLQTYAQKIVVKGFTEAQMFEFIGKYFKLVSEDSFGCNMKRIIEKDYKYRKLAKRPLFCVLLCMLYGSDVVSKLPERLSDLMFKIMLCLIKWNNKKVGNVDENTEAFPPEYEELFLSFGKLCFQALKTDKTRFSEKEILEMRGMFNSTLLLQLGFLSNDSENDVLGPKKFWKPVHKIFLEYLAGLYIANHSRECRDCKECKEFSSIYRHEHVLQFVVGTLDKKAHLALDGRRHPMFLHMKDTDLLMLLREAGPTKDNCRAVARLLDHSYTTVYTSEVDFEGWGSILAQKFAKLKSLEIVWRIKSSNPDQESSFTEASPELYSTFFSALKCNTSINKIKIRATQDGEPFSEEKIELFFSNLEMILPKENLRVLEIKELKMHVSSHFRRAIEGATCQMDKKPLSDLEILRLDMFMDDEDLYVLCDRLRKCAPNLKELQLTGLVIGGRGFGSLVQLLKKSKHLQKLYISMDKACLQPNKFTLDYTPSVMCKAQQRMNRHAVNESKRAYNDRKCSLGAEGTCNQGCSRSGAMKPRTHRNTIIPVVSLDKSHQPNGSEYYTEEELDNFEHLDNNEVNASKEMRSASLPSHQLLTPDEFYGHSENNGFATGAKSPKSRGSRSPSLSASDGRGRIPSPMGDPANTNYERMKDPTKELSYLFQDPFNSGTKTYQANHYTFIPVDGETPLPLPLCNNREHKSVFHELFNALPESSVKCLTLDYPCLYLSTLDLVCLGDAIRKTKCLETLKLQNLKMAKKYIPVLLGLGQCQSLTTVLLESKGVIITDASFAQACIALRHNTTLKSLSLAQWEFNIRNKEMASRYFRDLLSSWKVVDLNLSNCHIDTGMALAPTLLTLPLLLPIHAPTHNWSSIKTLRLPHVKLKEPMGLERRGHLLLPVLRNCPNLTVLDLSASSNHTTPLDDNATHSFFQILGTNFKKLKELTLCDWEFKFSNYEETCLKIGHLVRSCTELKVLVLDKVSEVRSGLSIRTPCRTTFLHQLVNNLPCLSELSLCCYKIDAFELDRDTASHLGACFHDHWNSNSKFKLKFFNLPPPVETALLEALKKNNFSVSVNQGYPLEITVKRRCFLTA